MHKTVKKELSFSLDTLERYKSRRREAEDSITSTNAEKAQEQAQEKTQEKTAKSALRLKTAGTQTTGTEIETTTKNATTTTTTTTISTSTTTAANSLPLKLKLNATKSTPTIDGSSASNNTASTLKKHATPGSYVNWSNHHTSLAAHPWCAMSDLIYFCDKYEFKSLSIHDTKTQQQIVAEVRAILAGKAPFDQRKRFPADIRDPENLWVCIGRCAGVEYHLNRILSTFRKPLDQLSPDKQRTVRQNFHLSVAELRLDISARISEVRLYDRLVFEREFRLEWQDEV